MKLKICGLKELANTKMVASLKGVSYMGLIFAPSPRQVSCKLGSQLASIIQAEGKKAVGVFVDEADELILKKARFLNAVQIYKDISLELYEALKALNLEVWQVCRVKSEAGFLAGRATKFQAKAQAGQGGLNLSSQPHADLVLFDTAGKLAGGNGISFNWDLLKAYKQPFALAGGIGVHNIKAAKELKPAIIDVNSKIEDERGLKERAKIEFIIKELGL